jgi:histidinol dehydrogenase
VAIWLDQRSEDFEARFSAFLSTKREVSDDVNAVVRDIIDDVRLRGDAALFDYSARFDRVDLATVGLRVSDSDIDAAVAATDPEVLEALKLAAERIEKHHARQMPKDDLYEDALGVGLGSRWTAVEAVGLYVPGGTASYPSSVLMNALPAKVAGVPRVVMVVPASGGATNPTVLAAARIAGVTEIYRVGGAQAIAALAYGTETIAPVAKIVGPGNAYVAAAKRQGLRSGGDRHDCRSFRSAHYRRWRERPGLDRCGPPGPGGARRGGPIDPDHGRPRLRGKRWNRRWSVN